MGSCRPVPAVVTLSLHCHSRQRKTGDQEPFRVRDLRSVRFVNRSLWAKGDLNPHVPKDTGT
jgi:hypothetical protein